MKKARPSHAIAVAAWELAVAAGIVLFWASFFVLGPAGTGDPGLDAISLAFETAFPVADLVLVCVLGFGAAGLLKGRDWGRSFTLAGGGMLIFLGLLDVTFNILQGIYRAGLFGAVMNGAINAACLGSGIVLSVWAGRRAGREPEPRGRREGLPVPKPDEGAAAPYSWDGSRP